VLTETVYNKWHETELERWLSDHNVPYPTPADRKDLENLVKDSWTDNVVTPYNSWDAQQLQKYLASTGESIKNGAVDNKDYLVDQVKSTWKDTSDSANDAYGSVQEWIFDT
jgi:Putative nuclear envelope organisation protein